MKIQIWSDIQCPFCYIGKRHLETALADFEHADQIEIEWKSFQLDPTIPEQLEHQQNVYEYLAQRKGLSVEQSKAMHDQVSKTAQAAGLTYNFDKAVVANSGKAHQIIQMAKQHQLGDQAEEVFFKAYFTDGKNLGNTETLVELAQEIGLSAEQAQEALTNNRFRSLVTNDIQEAAQIGVRGVPFFVLDQKYAISGAQPVGVFSNGLHQAFSEWKYSNSKLVSFGNNESTCSEEGCDF
ncbi:MAG: DsbA family oxidoreductase [Flavobacteriales bacterium]|nr:DsbA family oxidoreductase [Flavobacteriales bacterium]MCB9197192.1 DsbA family oxidoreductase [Flavobacteriales bacterium]